MPFTCRSLFSAILLSTASVITSAVAASKDVTPGTDSARHLGPVLSVSVQRGDVRLPLVQVDHLHKGDHLIVAPGSEMTQDAKWVLVVAMVNPNGNKVEARKFDLSEGPVEANVEVGNENQIPMIVLAPQVKTMFGLHTSFQESARLIIDAIRTDPQRFVDLQKVDQIDRAIALISAALEHIIRTSKPEQVAAASRAFASQLGVKYIEPSCFADNAVNTRCVVNQIVTSDDLLPGHDRAWNADGPNADAAKVPTDLLANLKIVSEATTYLANKYGDNYIFAPSSGTPRAASTSGSTATGASLQLNTNVRYKNGDVKTAYVYVPSWFHGKRPELSLATRSAICATRGEFQLAIKGVLPLANYWHDLTLSSDASDADALRIDRMTFTPESGTVTFDYASSNSAGDHAGRLIDATLQGKYAFSNFPSLAVHVAVPGNRELLSRLAGLDGLISGEKATLRLAGADAGACVEQLSFSRNGQTLASSSADHRNELTLDLSNLAPGVATIDVSQYGLARQSINVTVLPRKARVEKIVHYDGETVITVSGEQLDRIQSLNAGSGTCVSLGSDEAAPAKTRRFQCPAEWRSNKDFPDKLRIRHAGDQPAGGEVNVTRINARPRFVTAGRLSVLSQASINSAQWDLAVDDPLLADDASLNLVLKADAYRVVPGTYQIQLRIGDAADGSAPTLTVPVLADLSNQELRTREPIALGRLELPSVINPLWYRVTHETSGLSSDWVPLGRQLVLLPKLTQLNCAGDGKSYLLHGTRLDGIDALEPAPKDATGRTATASAPTAAPSLLRCEQALCLSSPAPGSDGGLRVKVHWIDDRWFTVHMNQIQTCKTH